METTRLTREHFDANNNFCGDESLLNVQGHIEIEGNLGWLQLPRLIAKGSIAIKAGTDIKAGGGIEAGGGIKAGGGIEADWTIKAGWGIEAGGDIKAGGGIQSQLSITCKKTLSSGLRIFAGLCWWIAPKPNELRITCSKLIAGEIAFGDLVETGIKEEAEALPPEPATVGHAVLIDGVLYVPKQ